MCFRSAVTMAGTCKCGRIVAFSLFAHAASSFGFQGGEDATAAEYAIEEGGSTRHLMRHSRHRHGHTGLQRHMPSSFGERRSAYVADTTADMLEPTSSSPALLASHEDRRRCAGLKNQRLVVEDCAGGRAQEWYFYDGMLRLKAGGCLYHAPHNDDVDVVPCRGGDNMKWHFDPAMRLRSRDEEWCLDRGGLNGDELFLSACSTSSSQVWLMQSQSDLLKALVATSQKALPGEEVRAAAEQKGLREDDRAAESGPTDAVREERPRPAPAALQMEDNYLEERPAPMLDGRRQQLVQRTQVAARLAERLADIKDEVSKRLANLQHDIDAELTDVGNSAVDGPAGDDADVSRGSGGSLSRREELDQP
eukprot:TRINITY_DN112722_c0_g1_i1.p1 TRINITY_DN112722_c0_g1~~TRINITY_DN112722_c0_g1_i1.p1  ORF type:complete len:364 (+),score=67.53 TRINITY_DN112722_c0_g1_i1:121-1212(+)